MDDDGINGIQNEEYEDHYGCPDSPEVHNNHESSSHFESSSLLNSHQGTPSTNSKMRGTHLNFENSSSFSKKCLQDEYCSDHLSKSTSTNWTPPKPDLTPITERKNCISQSGSSEYAITDMDNKPKGPEVTNNQNNHVKYFCMSSIEGNSNIAEEKITTNESHSSTKTDESSLYGKLKRSLEFTDSQPSTSKRCKEFEELEPLEMRQKKIIRKNPPIWSQKCPDDKKGHEQWIRSRNAEIYRRNPFKIWKLEIRLN